MNNEEIKALLDEKYEEYCTRQLFLEYDPIQIPHHFEKKEDIEIAGFMAASLAWGQRPTIIKKCNELMERMDNAPHDFIMNAGESDIACFSGFKHRTFNGEDCTCFLRALIAIYRNQGGLEQVFADGYRANGNVAGAIKYWREHFILPNTSLHAQRHMADINKGSAAKRINMFLRWMVRHDNKRVDFGLWHAIPMSDLLIPLDLHSGNTARELGLLTVNQNNYKAVCELTARLKAFNPDDPIKYDYSLFGIGAFAR